MAAVIDLSKFQSYFEELDESDVGDVCALEPYFFAVGTVFHQNRWYIKDAPKSARSINFEVPIAPGVLLTDIPDLLYTVKLALVLIGTSSDKRLGRISASANLHKACAAILNFLRVLMIRYKIRYLSSINQALADAVLTTYARPLEERLLIQQRLNEYLDGLSADQVEALKVFRGNRAKPDLDIFRIGRDLGVSPRSFQLIYASRLARFRHEHGFYIKPPTRKTLIESSTPVPEGLSESAIRKNLDFVKKFFAVLDVFGEFFPEQYKPSDDFFRSLDTVEFAKRHAVKSEGKTANIPQPVFFRLMDRAIRWVVDYAEPLIQYRDEAQAQFKSYLEGDNRGGSEENRKHYARKRMRKWFLENPLDALKGQPGAPFPIVGFEKHYRKSERPKTISREQIDQAKELIDTGMTQQAAAKEVGISKASLSRILANGWAEEGYGLDNVINHYLVTACLLVIYCFTARRECEIESLQAGCTWDTPNGPMIRLYSGKVEQRYDDFPTTRLVVKAVQILERLSEGARTPENPYLLQVSTMSGRDFQFWQSGRMNDFADLVGANGDSVNKWNFNEHQFRRFFAMTYFYRYDAGDLPTLSWHLRHTSFLMTEKYLTEREWQTAWDEVAAEKIEGILNQPGDFEGQVTQDLKALIESAEVQGGRRAKRMADTVQDIGVVMNHVPDGLCFGATPGFKERSACLYDGEVQLSSATRSGCTDCPNLAGFDKPEDANLIVEANQSPMLIKAKELACA